VSNNTAAKRIARMVAMTIGLGLALTALAWYAVTGSLRGMGEALAHALVYVVPAALLQLPTQKTVRRWVDAARFPLNWIVFFASTLAMALVTVTIATFLTVRIGLEKNWTASLAIDRIVVVVWMLFACGTELYLTTRSRLESRNRQLEDKVESERRALQLQQADFERAREIQQALMPTHLPQIQGCDLAAGCQPARMVGGDYFDAIRLGDARAAIAIGDVSGKGMAAALLMSNLQAIVRAFAPGGLAPAELCAKANQLIAGNVAPGKYITFFYAVIDAVHMRLDYCNAGHNPPILRRRDGTVERLCEGGPVLGVLPGTTYSAGAAELRSGDCLVLYTDGITEAFNAADEEFGEDRLIVPLQEPGDSSEERRKRIMVAVTEFSNGNFHDDATMLIASMH
jgi:sigma-B regulation protein RsbU (phosphoserine phosphatase)